jgi:hypothetical protein
MGRVENGEIWLFQIKKVAYKRIERREDDVSTSGQVAIIAIVRMLVVVVDCF